MQKIILMPTSVGDAQWHMNTTILNQVSKETIKKYISKEDSSKLDMIYQESTIPVWCLLPGKSNNKDWEKLNEGDVVIFVPSNDNLVVTSVTYKTRNRALAKALWETDSATGKTWELVFFVRILSVLNLTKRAVLSDLGYSGRDNLQGHRDVTGKFIRAYGSVEEFINGHSDLSIGQEELSQETSEKLINKVLPKKSRLEAIREKIAESEREKTDYVELKGKKIRRNQLIVAYVKETAGYKCQACGFSFEKKDGSRYVEAAHIKQLAKSHMDTIDNMVALCPNCHKKFDLGNAEARNEVFEALKAKGFKV